MSERAMPPTVQQIDALLDRKERDLLGAGLAAVVGPEEAEKHLKEMSADDVRAAFKRVFYGERGGL
jgi:hypothetical protein